MRTLDLSNNSITTIDGNAFDNNGALETINFSNNLLTDLYPGLFKSLSNLNTLNMDNNLIGMIHPETFSNNFNLRWISFVSNRIDAIHRTFINNLDQLRFLALSANLCVDRTFEIDEVADKEIEIHPALNKCYNNYIEITEEPTESIPTQPNPTESVSPDITLPNEQPTTVLPETTTSTSATMKCVNITVCLLSFLLFKFV